MAEPQLSEGEEDEEDEFQLALAISQSEKDEEDLKLAMAISQSKEDDLQLVLAISQLLSPTYDLDPREDANFLLGIEDFGSGDPAESLYEEAEDDVVIDTEKEFQTEKRNIDKKEDQICPGCLSSRSEMPRNCRCRSRIGL